MKKNILKENTELSLNKLLWFLIHEWFVNEEMSLPEILYEIKNELKLFEESWLSSIDDYTSLRYKSQI